MAKSPKVMPPNWRDAKFTKVKVPRNWPKDRSGLSIARWNQAADHAVNQILTKRELCDAVINDPFRATLALQGINMNDIDLKKLSKAKLIKLVEHERQHHEYVQKRFSQELDRTSALEERIRSLNEKIVERERMIRAIRMLTETAKLEVMFGLGKKDVND